MNRSIATVLSAKIIEAGAMLAMGVLFAFGAVVLMRRPKRVVSGH